ncbi:hypothetical protein SAMN04488570_0391 [Nocardioides scoriae]|uniref:Uncharacterized protein n=1 Tax=Nocardioides scoriae TaxID=642780 RepID=A0A1H1LYW7_9ACTN|nr:hypothetical protein SAMN04488570_0391 [Nocardioides scoriae]
MTTLPTDLLMVALSGAFFVLCWLLVRVLDR